VELIAKYLDQLDLVLVMTVNPGFGGQDFMPDMIEKIRFLKMAKEKRGLFFKIEVDGGINDQTAFGCVEAGANILVAGSYLFKLPDMAKGIQKLKEIL
jgi:ribulose-phosphate 3-epimerase